MRPRGAGQAAMSGAAAELRAEAMPEEGGCQLGTSQDLLQRLRELEAENSALAQANENQRETYERCLDEVANHVVQALLNQKDLREECIKLKRRVFDLERQNQTLSDLFQQKLQLAGGALPPLALHPVPAPANPPASPLRGSAEKPAASPPPGRCALHREVCGPAPPWVPLLARASHGSSSAPQVGSEGPWGGGSGPGPPALEALSPFFKKKAQILEVLRKLEETDPLLPACCGRPTQPSSDSCSTPLAGHQSRPESPGSPEGVNGAPTLEPWPGCLQLGSKWRGPEAEGGCASPSPEELVLSALAERRLGLGLLLEDAECYLHHVLCDGPRNGEPPAAFLLDGPPVLRGPRPVLGLAGGGGDAAALGCPEHPACLSFLAPGGEEARERSPQGPARPVAPSRAKVKLGPLSPGPPSPSKVLQLLKLPTPGDKPHPPPPPRLSPQLARSSKIPCRSHPPEASASPVLSGEGPITPEPSLATPGSPRPARPPAPRPPARSPEPLVAKPHDYENVSALALGACIRPALPRGAGPPLLDTPEGTAEPPYVPELCLCPPSQERGAGSPPAARRNTGGSAGPRKAGKKAPEPGHLPFKERLGKLRSTEAAERREPPCTEKSGCPSKDRGRMPARPSEDAAEPRVSARVGGSLKHQEHGPSAELPARCYLSGSVGSRLEAEACSGKHHITKTRPLATGCPAGPPPGARNPPRAPPAPPGKSTKSPHGSPTKLPSKSPTKAGAGKTAVPRPPTEEAPTGPERRAPEGPGGPGPPSAIEEKVMKGIEENVLRLQGQDRGPVPEVKQKDSRGLASWFGLRKSKLPALSRRPEPGKAKEERRERGPGATPLRREVRLAARKLEAESLNISKLMEKAEDLRKALEQEKAYLHGLARDRARPHGRREPTPSELQALYREVTAQDFMQQLLDRVDGKETSLDSRLEQKNELLELQRIPHDAKDPRLFRPLRNGIVGHLRSCEEPPEKVPDLSLREGLPPDDSLAEAVTTQLFPACGSLTRTLDSGIGTFPPPDYCSGVPSKPPPKPKSRSDTPPGTAPGRPPASTKVPRKARTLEREVPSLEDVPGPPGGPPSTAPPPSLHGHRVCPEATEPHSELGKPRRAQQGRNWTFPNIRASGGPAADPFLCTPGDLAGLRGPAGGSARSTTARKRAASEGPPPLPPPSLALSASSSRTPSASDVGEEGSTEAGSRDTGQGPAGLENSESLSDSLYDSLSSCGSQG
ncbi:nck-associated protein 5-like isoform X2 [Alligator mississippiensis]|uniref:nck-associated protein 5-like isoform X2 n=1 Tax=Alligator mississippiensis TaxID=8496 RepID=UPI0028779E34|nr:nck-associated protein 5-like isoform X2 [Alligator mississippiensis]